jgi:starvation-inducible DNA-binding protein
MAPNTLTTKNSLNGTHKISNESMKTKAPLVTSNVNDPKQEWVAFDLPEKDRKVIADSLSALLADTYVLYLRTLNYHWNVTGSMFMTLHVMFEKQYLDQAAAIDQIAERIRALGFLAPGSISAFSELASLKEEPGSPNANRMVGALCEGQEAVIRTTRQLISTVENYKDFATADLLNQRLREHEKMAWMLRSLLA